jgi:hypothetical protein
MADELLDAKRWPGVERAYDFVLPSYTLLVSRFEAADTRLTNVMTLASSLTLGIPLFAKSINPDLSFRSPWFVGAVVVFVIAIVIGFAGRVGGTLTLPDPAALYERWLEKPEWQFKKDAIYFAGQHFEANAKVIHAKNRVSLALASLLAVEFLLLVAWIAP